MPRKVLFPAFLIRLGKKIPQILRLIVCLSAVTSFAQWSVQSPVRVSSGETVRVEVNGRQPFFGTQVIVRVFKEQAPPSRSLLRSYFRVNSNNPFRMYGSQDDVPPMDHRALFQAPIYQTLRSTWNTSSEELFRAFPFDQPLQQEQKSLDERTTQTTTRQSHRLNLAPDFLLVGEQKKVLAPLVKSPEISGGTPWWSRSVELDPLKPGFYIIEFLLETKVAYLPCLVSDLLLKFEIQPGKIGLQAFSATTGLPARDARFWIARKGGALPDQPLVSGGDGRIWIDEKEDRPSQVLVMHGDDVLHADLSNLQGPVSRVQDTERAIFAYTERPIYRPGQEVFFKAIVRERDPKSFDWARDTVSPYWVLRKDRYSDLPQGDDDHPESVNPLLRGLPFMVGGPAWDREEQIPRGTALLVDKETLSFAGSFVLPQAAKPGEYSVHLRTGNAYHHLNFQVMDYQKPRFKVRFLDPPKVEGVSNQVRFLVKAEALHGGPVPYGKVAWHLFRVWKEKSQEWWRVSLPRVDHVRSGDGSTDAHGLFLLELPSENLKPEESYRLLAEVTDAGGQRQSVSRMLGKEAESTASLKLELSSGLLKPGEKLEVRTSLQDMDGNPLEQRVSLRIAEAKPAKEGDYFWNSREPWKPGRTIAEAHGPRATFRLPTGVFLVTGSATLPNGEKIEKQECIVVGEEGSSLPPVQGLHAALAPTAVGRVSMLVLLPRPGLWLQWRGLGQVDAIRGERKVAGTAARIEFHVPKSSDFEGWLHLEVLDGDQIQQARIFIGRREGTSGLNLSLEPDRADYRPNGTMKLKIRATDRDGRSPRTALSLGVVDEALYTLAPELFADPAKVLNPPPPAPEAWAFGVGRERISCELREVMEVQTRVTKKDFQEMKIRGASSAAVRVPMAGATVEVQATAGSVDSTNTMSAAMVTVGSPAPTEDSLLAAKALSALREHFLDTALWIPDLVVKGKLTVDVPLPEDLTQWRATAIGVTSDGKAGVGRASVKVNKPLQVNLVVPPFLTEGDESRAVVVLQNRTTKSVRGQLVLEAEGGGLPDGARQPFELKGGEERRVAFRLLAQKGKERMVLKAGAAAGSDQDGEKRELPLHSPAVDFRVQQALVLGGTVSSHTVKAPSFVDGPITLHLYGISGGLEQLTAPSLRYMIRYPYGCVEQTLSSFFPNILVAELVKGGLLPPLEGKDFENLDLNIQKGVERVYGYQMDNGGWGWYGAHDFGASANPHTTGYAVLALSSMKRLGYRVDEARLEKGLSTARGLVGECLPVALDSAAPGRDRARGDVAFLLGCLARAESKELPGMNEAADAVIKGQWPGESLLAQVAMAAAWAGHPKTKPLLDSLEASVRRERGTANWAGSETYRYGYLSGDIYTTVTALRALCTGRPRSPLIPEAEAFLLTAFDGQGWDSTWVSSQVVALLPDLAKVRRIQWEGAPIEVLLEDGSVFDLSDATKPASQVIKAGSSVQLKTKGKGVVVCVFTSGTQKAMMSPKAGNLRLQTRCELWKLESPKGESRLGWRKRPWDGHMQLNEEAMIEVEASANRGISYGLVEVPVPPGFEAIPDLTDFVLEGQDLGNQPQVARLEVHPDRVAYLVYTMDPRNPVKLRLRLRARMEGIYRMRPVKFSLMGDESLWCTSDGSEVRIEGGSK